MIEFRYLETYYLDEEDGLTKTVNKLQYRVLFIPQLNAAGDITLVADWNAQWQYPPVVDEYAAANELLAEQVRKV